MYQISGCTRNDTRDGDPMRFLEQELEKMRVLVERLTHYQPLVQNFGFISKEANDYAERMMQRYASSDEGIPDEVMAELERITQQSEPILLLKQPEEVLSILQKQNAHQIEEDGSPTVSLGMSTIQTGGVAGTLDRYVFWKDRNFGSIRFGLPMRHKNDVWFQDWRIMREMIGIFIDLWEFSWLTVKPSVYNSALKYVGEGKPLFDHRRSFGWMGYTAETLSETGDVLDQTKASCHCLEAMEEWEKSLCPAKAPWDQSGDGGNVCR